VTDPLTQRNSIKVIRERTVCPGGLSFDAWVDLPRRGGDVKITSFRLDPFCELLQNAVLKLPEVAFQPKSHLMFVTLPQLESVIQAKAHDRDE
jgi:hypothetical protein